MIRAWMFSKCGRKMRLTGEITCWFHWGPEEFTAANRAKLTIYLSCRWRDCSPFPTSTNVPHYFHLGTGFTWPSTSSWKTKKLWSADAPVSSHAHLDVGVSQFFASFTQSYYFVMENLLWKMARPSTVLPHSFGPEKLLYSYFLFRDDILRPCLSSLLFCVVRLCVLTYFFLFFSTFFAIFLSL